MIDYITIMRKVILFINSAVTQEKIDKYINDSQIHKSLKLKYKITNNFDEYALVPLTLFIVTYTIITKNLIYTAIASIIALIPLLFLKVMVFSIIKQPLRDKAIQECELNAANILPDDNITLDDIIAFNKYHENEAVQHFECTMPSHFPVNKQYERGNLYDLPVTKLLETVNVKSTKNLLSNILYLNDYYKNNYVNDNRYDWVNKQLNEFYNPTEPTTNNSILRNLKN